MLYGPHASDSPFSSKRFRRQLKLAAGIALSYRHFRGRFSLEECAVPLCENRLPSTVALHPHDVGESVVGNAEVNRGAPRFRGWLAGLERVLLHALKLIRVTEGPDRARKAAFHPGSPASQSLDGSGQ